MEYSDLCYNFKCPSSKTDFTDVRRYLVLEFIGLVFIVNGYCEYRHLWQIWPFRLVHFGEPLVLRELRWHVVYVFDPYRRRPGTCQETQRKRCNDGLSMKYPRRLLKYAKRALLSPVEISVAVSRTRWFGLSTFVLEYR